MDRRLLGGLSLSLAAALWGGMYAFSSWVLGGEYLQPFGLLVVRLTATALVLGPLLARTGPLRLDRSDWVAALGLGFVGFVLSLGAQFVGTKWAGAANGSLITSSSPAFIILFGALLLRERVASREVGAVLLATLGVAVVVDPEALVWSAGDRALAGKLLLLAAGLSWGLYTVMGKQFSARHGALATTFWACLVGAALNLPLALLEPGPRPFSEWTLAVWLGVAYIALVSTTVAFFLWNYGFELLPAAKGAVFFFLQPIVGAFLGWSLLGEQLGPGFFAGGALIGAGLLLAARAPRSSPSPTLSPEGREPG